MGDVLAVVRTETEAVCGVFAVWGCNDAMVIVGLQKYPIMASGIVAVLIIIVLSEHGSTKCVTDLAIRYELRRTDIAPSVDGHQ